MGQPNKGVLMVDFRRKLEDDVDVYDLIPSGAVMVTLINTKSSFLRLKG